MYPHVSISMRPKLIWLVVSTPLKSMKVNRDDEIPNVWKNKSHVPNHQAVICMCGNDWNGHLPRGTSRHLPCFGLASTMMRGWRLLVGNSKQIAKEERQGSVKQFPAYTYIYIYNIYIYDYICMYTQVYQKTIP